jgi:hypothetical protein
MSFEQTKKGQATEFSFRLDPLKESDLIQLLGVIAGNDALRYVRACPRQRVSPYFGAHYPGLNWP